MKNVNLCSKMSIHKKGTWGLCIFLFIIMVLSPVAVIGQDNLDKGTSPFDGFWLKTQRQHTDCSYSAESDITFSTDASSVTRAVCDALGKTKGKVDGNTYIFDYGIENGVPSGKGIFTLNDDCRTFSGTFSDVKGHKGTWSGKRGSQFDGVWSKTQRQHTDCSYSAKSDITFSTDAGGVTIAGCDALGTTKGRVEGRTYVFDYGIVNGVPSGKGTFTLGDNCKTFTGTFSDVNGHRGNWSGRR